MGKLSDIKYKITNKINAVVDKLLAGKNKELILYTTSMVVNSILLVLVCLNLVYIALEWINKPLFICLLSLYVSTFVFLFCLRNLIKDSKKHLKERKPSVKKTKKQKLDEVVENEMKQELGE